MPSAGHDKTSTTQVMTSLRHVIPSLAHAQPCPGDVMPSMRQLMTVGVHAMRAGLQATTAPRHALWLACSHPESTAPPAERVVRPFSR